MGPTWLRLKLLLTFFCADLSVRPVDEWQLKSALLAFLRNLERGEAYQSLAPTLWDIDFRSAIAQAELEDREQQASYHRLAFHRTDGTGDVLIETTRPG